MSNDQSEVCQEGSECVFQTLLRAVNGAVAFSLFSIQWLKEEKNALEVLYEHYCDLFMC